MDLSPKKTDEQLVRYLLGLLTEAEMLELEETYLPDDELNDELQATERELIDRFVEGALSNAEQQQFEAFFLASPGRREKLRFARAMKTYGEQLAAGRERAGLVRRRLPLAALQSFFNSRAGLAAAAILALAVGLIVWRVYFFQSADQQVLIALSKAYRAGRLFEARISELDYAPMAQARGAGEQLDKASLNHAELLASNEVSAHPGAASFHTLGRVYLAKQDFDDAIEWLRKAAAAGPENPRIHSDLAAALLEKARLDSDPEKRAEGLMQSFEQLNKALELDDNLLEALFDRALWYEAMHNPERAAAEWRNYLQKDSNSRWAGEARQRLEQLEEKKSNSYLNREKDSEEFASAAAAGDEASAWQVLSRNRKRTGNVIIQRLLDEDLDAAERNDTAAADARLRLLSLAGKLELERTGDGFTAELAGWYLRAGGARRKLLVSARSWSKSAYAAYEKTEFETAIEAYRNAERIFTDAGDECEAALAQSWVGQCYLRIPRQTAALAIFEPLAQFCARHDYKWLLGYALVSIGDAWTASREFSKSLNSVAKSLEVFEAIQDASGRLRCGQTPVLVAQQAGNYYKSIGLALRGLELANSFSPEPQEIYPFYQFIAIDLNSLGSPSAALEFQELALRWAVESGMPLLKSRAHALLSSIELNLHHSAEALRHAEAALAEARGLGGEQSRTNLIAYSTLNLAHLLRQLGEFGQAISCYDRAIQMHRQKDLQLYAVEAHTGKLQALLELNDERGAAAELNAATGLLERERFHFLEESNRNSYFDLAQNTYDLAIEFAYFHLRDVRHAFEYCEASRARSLLDLVSAGGQLVTSGDGSEVMVQTVQRPMDLAELQRRLPENSQLLQYAVLKDQLVAWVVSKDSVASAATRIAAAELTRLVNEFTSAITKTPASDAADVNSGGKALYDILINPVRASLKPGHLVFIVPDKILNYVPFGALVPESGKYFLEDQLFELAPSASLVIICSERASTTAKLREEKLLCIGNPSFDRAEFSTLQDLPAAASEAESVARFYGTDDPLIGPAAQTALVKERMQAANVIHFAGHYIVDERSPLRSRLLLSKSAIQTKRDGMAADGLSAAEIYSLTLPRVRLVVLSACQTGIERYYRGEGAIGIARPFIKAGAPLVVASLWPVESEPSSKLMVDFHSRRKAQGSSTAEALRQAQLEMLSGPDPTSRAPRAWAGFVTIGGFAEF